jgi:uncharacterized damage-inducible protein DinB
MREPADAVRDHLVRALGWEDAHVGFDKAVAGVPPDKRGAHGAGFEHSLWQLVEHIRIAQDDILDFCINANYEHTRKWPDDYWPKEDAPPSEQAWDDSIAAYRRSLEALKQLARDVDDLTAPVAKGKPNQTYLREILLVIDHNAYHAGQLIDVRRALGIWR